MKINYLLIDYENVQPKHLTLLQGAAFRILVFLGEKQTKLPVELVTALQTLGKDAEYIQISGNGPNSLDFHIAFTIGELSKSVPDAFFHILSKDKGFDPLIRHARNKGISIKRSEKIEDIPLLNNSTAKTITERVDVIVGNLKGRGASRPRKVKTLTNTIDSQFNKKLSEAELKRLLNALEKQGHISIDGESVTYHF